MPETYLAETANDKFYPRIQCALPCDHDVRGYPCYECDCLEHDHEFEMEYKHDPENCGCKPENTQKRNSGIIWHQIMSTSDFYFQFWNMINRYFLLYVCIGWISQNVLWYSGVFSINQINL